MFQAVRFTAGNARCALLEGAGIRLELIEVDSLRPMPKVRSLYSLGGVLG